MGYAWSEINQQTALSAEAAGAGITLYLSGPLRLVHVRERRMRPQIHQ
jgi:hypothetical protein